MSDEEKYDHMSQIELEETLDKMTREEFPNQLVEIAYKRNVQQRHDYIMLIKGEEEMIPILSQLLGKLKNDHRLNELVNQFGNTDRYDLERLLNEYNLIDF